MIDTLLQWLDELACSSEDLELVVFGGAEHDPWIVLVPVEVADAIREATVHEQPNNVSVK